jgi:purine nucleosidase
MSSNNVRRIILDTDPGIDDALAIFLALNSPEIQLEAVTTVSGNVPVAHTTDNALALLALANHPEIPVASGSAVPLIRPYINAAHVHGDNGLGGVQLPIPQQKPIAQHAVDLIIERILQAPGEITLVAIGPLTNLALALRKEPRIAEQVREVVIMGGALRVTGNVTPCAEFNIYADPHAAQIVLQASWPIRLVALDVTNQVTVSREQIHTWTAQHPTSSIATCAQQIMEYYFQVFAPAYGTHNFTMHDPLSLAAAFQPDLFTWQPLAVDVELTGTHTLGETVPYTKNDSGKDFNVQAAVAVDGERFIKMFFERVH